MLTPADVLKIKCEFVNKVLEILTARKYKVDVCTCELKSYYIDALLVDKLYPAECLEFVDHCRLEKLADSYPEVVACTATTVECTDQADITLTATTVTCTHTATLRSSNNTAYPDVFTTNDSQYVNGSIGMYAQGVGVCANAEQSVTVTGGCTSSGCSNSHKAIIKRGFQSDNTFSGDDDAFIKTLRVYKTDALGTLDPTPIDLDLDPATSVYLADTIDCPGCTPILASELYISDTNFETTFVTLMDNVSLALFGTTGLHLLEANGYPSGTNWAFQVLCTAKHKPSSEFFGINTNDALVVVEGATSGSTYTRNAVNYAFSNPIRFYYDSTTFEITDYPCADLTPVIGNQFTQVSWNNSTTSFNNIGLLSPYAINYPISITSDSSVTCADKIFLSASYIVTPSSVEWLDPSLVQIATTATTTIDAADTGVYTFNLTTSNGCVISETITIS